MKSILHPLLSILLLVAAGCVGPMTFRQAQLPDGSEIRVYHAGAFLAPSVTVVALRAAGSTNWTLPQTFSGQGLVSSASTGAGIAAAGALLRPSHADTYVNTSGSTVNNVPAMKPASKPPKIKPPKYHD